MVKSTVTKIKQVCSITLNHLICGEIHSASWRFQKLPVRTLRRMRKNTRVSCLKVETENQICHRVKDRVFEPNPPLSELFNWNLTQNSFTLFSPPAPTKTETHYEKCKQLVKKIFGEMNEHPATNVKRMQTTNNENNETNILQNKETVHTVPELFDLNIKQNPLLLFTPKANNPHNESHSEKCQRIINEIFGKENKTDNVDTYSNKTIVPYTETLKTTTAKYNEEKLAQKIENIAESHSMGANTSEIEDLNINPKMLGRGKEIKSVSNNLSHKSEDRSLLCEGKNSGCNVPTFDELAKRCLDSPSNKIDDKLLKEMGKLGVPSSTGLSRKIINNDKSIQSEIVENSLKPKNTTLDLMPLNYNVSDEMQMELSPPYELSIGKSYNSRLMEINNELNDIRENLNSFLYNEVNEIKDYHIQDKKENNQNEINENENAKIIRNLLQTRIEHLTQVKFKHQHLTSDAAYKTERETDTGTDFKLDRLSLRCGKENANCLLEDEPMLFEPGVILRDVNIDKSHLTKKFDPEAITTSNLEAKEFIHPSLYYSDHTHTNIRYNQNIKTCNTEIQGQEEISTEKNYGIENSKYYKAEEPILAVETSRLLPYDSKMDEYFTDHDLEAIHPENLVSPLLDKGTVTNLENTKKTEIPALELQNLKTNEELTLSDLLQMIRERNRRQSCRELIVRMQGDQVERAVGKCGTKPPPCPPPAPTCPKPVKPMCPPSKPTCPQSKPSCPPPKPVCPPPKPVCPPAKPVCPTPKPVCPTPKPGCPPPKPTCPKSCESKCPPSPPAACASNTGCPSAKKNPCDMCQPTYSCEKFFDALTLLSYLGPHYNITQKNLIPIFACAVYLTCIKSTSKAKMNFNDFMSCLQSTCNIDLLACFENQECALESTLLANSGDVTYTKSFEPWSPIPSLSFPEKIPKQKLVCPKEGCKDTPPKLNEPRRNVNPCINFPKPNSLTKR